MAQINVYIGFNGRCREAMNFYRAVLGGELFFQTVGESPMAAQCPESTHAEILHSSLTNSDLLLMATDMTGPAGYHQGNNIAISLNCGSKDEIEAFFAGLSEGGKVMDPLKEQFWGAIFGALTDKFGIGWMLNCNIK